MRNRTRKEEIAPLLQPRVNYKMLMRHEALGRAREPPEKPVCTEQRLSLPCPRFRVLAWRLHQKTNGENPERRQPGRE